MSRDHDITRIESRFAAAAAGTVNQWQALPDPGAGHAQAFLAEGFYWYYETTEANADNTMDFNITYGAAGTGTTVFTNANANGLLDTGAVLNVFTNRRDAAIAAGAAAAASDPADVRIPVGNQIQFTLVTAGTGTVPAIVLGIYGKYV